MIIEDVRTAGVTVNVNFLLVSYTKLQEEEYCVSEHSLIWTSLFVQGSAGRVGRSADELIVLLFRSRVSHFHQNSAIE